MAATQFQTQLGARPADTGSFETEGLVDRAVRMMYGTTGLAVQNNREPEDVPETVRTVSYPDGYVRQTPVQLYRTPEDYYKRRVIKAVTVGLFVAVVGVALWALIRSGIFGHFTT